MPPQPGILLVTTGNRLGVNELIEPPGADPETQPKLAGLAQTEYTLTPTKTALIFIHAWLHRSLTRSSFATEAMGAGGRGYGCENPRHYATSFNPLQAGRKDGESGRGAVLRVDTRFFLSLSFSSLLSVSVSEQVSFSALSSHPPSFLLPFLFTHTFTNVQLMNIPALIHHRPSFIGQLEAHTLPHTPTH